MVKEKQLKIPRTKWKDQGRKDKQIKVVGGQRKMKTVSSKMTYQDVIVNER